MERAHSPVGFGCSVAVVIGIDEYTHIRRLNTAVSDALRLATLLCAEHSYTNVITLTEEVTRRRLCAFFADELPGQVGPNDRLLIYFAGHGIALDGQDGPEGYLIPQDARSDDRDTFVAMAALYDWLAALPCRHLLAIFDCCFAGAFTWYRRRNLRPVGDTLYREHYDRFVREPAWQILTSAAYDQESLDVVAGRPIGERGELTGAGERHSPFAQALFEALAGAGDLIPKGGGDGVVTATELYLYLRQAVELQAETQANHAQTPELWPFNRSKHGRGEYIFLVPGHGEPELPPAPPLSRQNNPYRGLESYEEEHADLFFGRRALVESLAAAVAEHPLTVVLGASGTGKSSVVKAGLVPYLKRQAEANSGYTSSAPSPGYFILPPMRPGDEPLRGLAELVAVNLPGSSELPGRSEPAAFVYTAITSWLAAYPDQRLLLIIDQAEELFTLCRDDEKWKAFLAVLATLIEQQPDRVRSVLTLRTDFEPQFHDSPLNGHWRTGRFIVPLMSQSEFREVIELPATARVLFFDPPELVDRLIDEVIQTPGALPLLSFTLEQLYLKYLERQEQAQRDGVTLERSLTWADYDELGGVIGSLRRRADEIYATLPDDDYRATMQRVMLRMVAVDGGELARRRVTLSELKYSSQQENTRVQTVLDWLIDARLLVKGSTDLDGGGVADSVVEPAHDALVAAWDKLLQWKRQAEESLPLQRRLWQAASEWDAAPIERRSGLLWDTNPRLPQLEETLWPTHSKENGLAGRTRWVRQVLWPKTELPVDTAWLNRAEVAFVRASVKRRASGLRRIIASTAAVIVALSLALLFAEGQRRTAIAERDLARRQATLAEAGRISALGFSTLSDRDLDRALLLSVEAYRAVEAIEDLAPPMAARSMLLSALQHEPHQLAILRLPDIDPNDCTSVDEHLHIQQTFLRRYDADFAAAYTAASRAGFPDCAKETSFAPSSAEWDWSDEDEDNCFDSAGTLLAPYDQLATRFSDSDRSISDCFFSSERSLAALSVSTQPIGAGGMGQVELQLRLWRSLQWNVTSFYYVEQCAIETVDGIWQYEQQGRNLRIWKQDQLEIFPVYEVVLPAPSDAARHYGHYQVSSVTISPNQALIAATATSGRFEDFVQIFLWDAPSLQLVGEFFRDETWHASDFEESDQINVIKFLSDDELQLCYIERSPLFADATRRDLPLKTVTFAVTEQYWLNYACQVAGRNFTSEEWNSYFPGTPYRTTCEL